MQSTRDGRMFFDYLADKNVSSAENVAHSLVSIFCGHPKVMIILLISSFTSHSILMQFRQCVHIFFAVLKDLVKISQQVSYTFKDPITECVECLYVDFDGAQKKLREFESMLVNDFFLTFCHIHHCISINMLADKLNMTPKEAERWIVNLIRNARLDAKIDSKLGHVVVGSSAVSPYQQVIEKAKSFYFRS
ncbi:Eukaryotic translation initiation factor 3 subunit E [Plecturocebus cupreus]